MFNCFNFMEKNRMAFAGKREQRRSAYERNRAEQITLPRFLRIIGSTGVSICWEAFLSSAAVVYFFTVTYETFFSFENVGREVRNIIDALYFIDIVARFALEFYRYYTGVECNFFYVPFSLSFWLYELVASCPIDIIVNQFLPADRISFLILSDVLRFNRFLRLRRMYKFLELLGDDNLVDEFFLFLIKFFTTYIIFIQFVACCMIWMSGARPLDDLLARTVEQTKRDTWFGQSDRMDPGFIHFPWNNFVLSFSFATSIVTTVGYGDLVPRNELEMIFGILVMLIGAIGLAGIFGSTLTSFLLERDGARFDLFYRLSIIKKKLKRMHASALFIFKTHEYYDFLWNFREGVYHVQLIKSLPTCMHEDILYDICTEMFHKAILFRDLEETFLRAVSRVVEVVLYNPDMIICQQGTYAMTMFYIIQGECLVKAKHNSNVVTAVLRAGCVFGESSLFFSFPYASNIETKTCCQLLRLSKEKLMEVFVTHYYVLTIMRTRIQLRMAELRRYYEIVGKPPVTWVQFRPDIELLSERPYYNYPTILRWATGFNAIVREDIIDDTEAPIIIRMPCFEKKLEKDNTESYKTCVVPPTLITGHPIVNTWHYLMMFIILSVLICEPYNVAFGEISELSYYTNLAFRFAETPITIIFIFDVMFEIATACPVTGIYYRFRDGLKIKRTEFTFYLDLIAAIPFAPIYVLFANTDVVLKVITPISIVTGCVKLWKIVRYLRYLDNTYPLHIFIFRLIHTTAILVYGSHFLACIMFIIACPLPPANKPRQCNLMSWLGSSYIKQLVATSEPNKETLPDYLANNVPYLTAMHFSVATLSSAGFGDYSPISRVEQLVLIVCELIGFFIIGYYTALLTSALSCTTRPRLFFEQKLITVHQFLDTAGLGGNLRDRIVEHYTLQHQFTEGVILPPHVKQFMYDAPPYLEGDALYAEAQIHLEGAPIFTKADPRIIIRMARCVDRFVLPPNIYFLRRGDVRRQMYIIYKGSLAVLKEDTNEIKAILEATSYLGIRDLLFGEPSHNNVKTLSYCLVYSIDLKSFLDTFEKDPDLMDEVESRKEANAEVVAILTRVYTDLRKSTNQAHKERKPVGIPSWIKFPTPKSPKSDVCDLEEFEEPYRRTRFAKFMKCILLRRTIHPAGAFALFWNMLMGIASLFLILCVALEAGYELNHPRLFIFRYGTHALLLVDIYVKMHWAYYAEGFHLVCHPLKTAEHFFFDGPFVYSYLCGLLPYEFIIVIFKGVNLLLDGNGFKWLLQLRWACLFNLIRAPIIIQYGRSVYQRRTLVLLGLYLSLTLVLCTFVTAAAYYEACPVGITDITVGVDLFKLPACTSDAWVLKKVAIVQDLDNFWSRWIAGMYYVSQTVFVIGFGDMVDSSTTDLTMLILMMLFGFIIFRCIVSDLTASAVDTEEVRAAFIERKRCLTRVMTKERIDPRMIANILEHLHHTWVVSNGLQPQDLFHDLHPALQADLFQEYIGAGMAKIPIFFSVRENVLRTICQYLRKQYFTRGERLMRIRNIEDEMFIVVEGDIWITNMTLEIQCTIGPGESMGETEMIFGGERRYSAIAANNVEVFVLNSTDFSKILERYPGLRKDMIKSMVAKRDLFERKIMLIQSRFRAFKNNAQHEIHVQRSKNSEMLRQILYFRDPNDLDTEEIGINTQNVVSRFFSTHILDWGSKDFDLPFLYFASPRVRKRFSILIHPKCTFYKIFSSIVLLVCIISSALGTYFISFVPAETSEHLEELIVLSWICESIMILHIILQFLLPFPTVEGKFCKLHRKIAFHYVSNFTQFFFDVIATFPVQLLERKMLRSSARYLNIFRCLRIVHYWRSHANNRNSITVSTFRYNILISVPFFCFLAHILACIFYGISPCHTKANNMDPITACGNHGEDDKITWTNSFVKDYLLKDNQVDPESLRVHLWYVRSLYWVVTTISTTGFGDIVAENLSEIAVAVVCIFTGAFILSIILSQFTSGVTSLTRKYREYMYQVRLLAKYLRNIGLTASKKDQVLQWFQMHWRSSRGVAYQDATKVLPSCMRIDLNLALYREVLSQTPIFQTMGITFLRRVADRVSHTLYLAGINIVTEGDKGHTLHIVYKGKVAGYRKDSAGVPILMRWYEKGACFGRLPSLFYNESYTKSYRAEQNTEILLIHQKDLFILAQDNPKFAKRLQGYIKNKYSVDFGSFSIFHPPPEVQSKTNTSNVNPPAFKRHYSQSVKLANEKKQKSTTFDTTE